MQLARTEQQIAIPTSWSALPMGDWVAAELQERNKAHRDIGAPGQRLLRQILRQTPTPQDGGEGLDQRLDGAGRGFDRQGLCSGWFGKDVTPQML